MVEIKDVEPGKWYRLGKPIRLLINLVVCEVAKIMPVKVKNFLYRRIGVTIGEGTVIAPHVQIDPFYPEKIKIGENVLVGWGAKILTHEFNRKGCRVGKLEIGDNSLIGHGASNRPGITVGENATVGAQSFINRDIEEDEKVGGVPVRELD